MCANKHVGVRAALISNEHDSIYCRLHNNANVICMGAKHVSFEDENDEINPIQTDTTDLDFIFEKGQYGVAMLPHRLAKRFFEATKSMTDVTVYGDFGTNVRVPNVTINVKGHTAEEVKNVMRKNHIAVKAGTFDAPRLAKSLGCPDATEKVRENRKC
mgnify:CR=1 FL=1